jgi:hypothetical protein
MPVRSADVGMLIGLGAVMAILQLVCKGTLVARLFVVGAGLVLFIEMLLFWGYCFAIVCSERRGDRAVERPDFTDLGKTLSGGLSGTLATLPLLALANLGQHYSLPSGVGDREVPFYLVTSFVWTPLDTSYFTGLGARLAAAGPLWWLVWALYLALLPMVLLGCSEGGLAGLNPLSAVRRIAAVGRDYATSAIAVLLLGALAIGLQDPLAASLTRLPFLGAWLAACLTVYLYFVASALLGDFAHIHGEALGLGTAEEFSDPALPGVEPRGAPPTAG